MWNPNPICLIVAVVVLHVLHTPAVANNSTCSISVPFSPNLVDTSFRLVDDCYRPSAEESISIFSRMFVYWPRHGSPDPCPVRYVVRIRTPPRPPLIVYLPSPDNYEPIFNAPQSDMDAVCSRLQRNARRRLFVNDSSRPQFIEAVRAIAQGLKRIKNFQCDIDSGTGAFLPQDERKKSNLGVDGILTYLHTLAFSHGFCLA
ncbi:hypothetical protein BWQ96_09232 [Gracilariopsis chorda]|uniref:Uncharacterized protein n=1 Tax=Gracilariopsis chorda TaxID=448386 RepID=A0A2V3IG86_9FLOR|nr:hypothetical protein BWQ96_09232 [Gracilariopsis chorda]|eukprot:PXF41053.1 hypothetical protein BWQ96_09232 [Gracilariopsis chorda]